MFREEGTDRDLGWDMLYLHGEGVEVCSQCILYLLVHLMYCYLGKGEEPWDQIYGTTNTRVNIYSTSQVYKYLAYMNIKVQKKWTVCIVKNYYLIAINDKTQIYKQADMNDTFQT